MSDDSFFNDDQAECPEDIDACLDGDQEDHINYVD
jgi:hypothetical protein